MIRCSRYFYKLILYSWFFSVLIFVTKVDISRPTIYWLQELHLVLDDTVFIVIETDPTELSAFHDTSRGTHRLLVDFSAVNANGSLSSENTRRLLRHLDSVFMIAVRSPRGREYENFTSEVKARIKEAPFYSKAYDEFPDTVRDLESVSESLGTLRNLEGDVRLQRQPLKLYFSSFRFCFMFRLQLIFL